MNTGPFSSVSIGSPYFMAGIEIGISKKASVGRVILGSALPFAALGAATGAGTSYMAGGDAWKGALGGAMAGGAGGAMMGLGMMRGVTNALNKNRGGFMGFGARKPVTLNNLVRPQGASAAQHAQDLGFKSSDHLASHFKQNFDPNAFRGVGNSFIAATALPVITGVGVGLYTRQ